VSAIHATAIVDPAAELAADVVIGPYAIVGAGVQIDLGTTVGAHCVIEGPTRIGRDNRIFSHAALGAAPQDMKYGGEPTRLEIGDRNTIREFVTINRGTIKGGGVTKVGDGCLLMACCHVAHDCELADRIIMGNNVLLAGHVSVGEQVNIAGGAAAHQFVTIGDYAYVGAMTRVVQEVPPYVILHDRSLRDIARRRPADLGALRLCYGVGPAKAERWGEALLAVVRGG